MNSLQVFNTFKNFRSVHHSLKKPIIEFRFQFSLPHVFELKLDRIESVAKSTY